MNKSHAQARFILHNLIFPGLLLLTYSGAFVLFGLQFTSHIFLNYVNFYYSLFLIVFSLLIMLLGVPAVILLRKRILPSGDPASSQFQSTTASLWIALLPQLAVVRYLLANQDILTLLDIIVVIVACLGASFVLVVTIPVLLRRYGSFRLLVSIAGAFVFTIMHMASISGLLYWLEMGNPAIELSFFAITLAAIWLLLGLKHTRELAFVVIIFLVGSTALQLLTQRKTPSVEATPDTSHYNRLAELIADKPPIDTPNIYLLVYDAYVPNETMLSYGIDNSDQERFLAGQGFTLYPHIYSVGSYTLASMNSTFNVTLEPCRPSRKGVSGDGIIHGLFRSLGYQVMGIFPYDYLFRGVGPHYDYYIPPREDIVPSYQLLLSAMWMGEFRHEMGLKTISHEEYIQAKREVFTATGDDPIFVYTHSSLPDHSQLPRTCSSAQTERYASDLRKANEEMRQDVAAITANDPDAIVIVAGDHGPYLTKNCAKYLGQYDPAEITRLDIQDRYSAFLAIRWPTKGYSEYDQITVLQDIFPSVFAWMYRDPALLDARVEPITVESDSMSGVFVRDGVIVGGADDGQPLFLSGE